MSRNRVYATFFVKGQYLDPDVITALSGIEPSQSWRHGEESRLLPGTFHQFGGWGLKSFEDRDANDESTVSECVTDLVNMLNDSAVDFSSLTSQYDSYLTIVIHVGEESAPPIILSPDILAALYRLHCHLDIDLYCDSK